jgi:hypothetical protein
MLRIFINSCGDQRQDPAHEYRWRCYTNDAGLSDAQALLSERKFEGHTLADLVQSDSKTPSIAFARDNGELMLLIMRLPSNRRSSQGDMIYNSICMVGPERSLPVFRKVIVDLLLYYPGSKFDGSDTAGILQALLSQVVVSDDREGFTFNPMIDLIDELTYQLEQVEITEPIQKTHYHWTGMIGHNWHGLREELAYQMSHFSFPKSDGPLVVVTGVKHPLVLQQACVWRGLTQMFESTRWEAYTMSLRKRAKRRWQERKRSKAVLTYAAV